MIAATNDGRDLVAAREEVNRLSMLLSKANATVEAQQKKIRRTRWVVFGVVVLAVVLSLALLFQRLTAPSDGQELASQAATTPMPQKDSSLPGAGKVQRAQSEPLQRRHKNAP